MKKRSKKSKTPSHRKSLIPPGISPEEYAKGTKIAAVFADQVEKQQEYLMRNIKDRQETINALQDRKANTQGRTAAAVRRRREIDAALQEANLRLEEALEQARFLGQQSARPPRLLQEPTSGEYYITSPRGELVPISPSHPVGMQERLNSLPRETGYQTPRASPTNISISPQRPSQRRMIVPRRQPASQGHLSPQRGGAIAPLWNDQIDKVMAKESTTYLGTIPSDLVKQLPIPRDKDSSFIVNTAAQGEEGQHWIAVYISPKKSMTLEVFDSLAQEPDNKSTFGRELLQTLGEKIQAMQLPYMLRFKSNLIPLQKDTTNTCGYYAIEFILNRELGHNFSSASGYDSLPDIRPKREKEISKLAKKLKKIVGFGYI